MWAFGGYPCGEYPDLTIAREAYVLSVDSNEKTMADKGYKDSIFFILPDDKNKYQHKLIMSRHETVNKRIRQFKILQQTFRNSIKKHPIVFHAVINITQLIIKNEDPLFNII